MADFDFSHLTALEVDGTTTREFTLDNVQDPETGEPVVLVVAPATEDNKPFLRALLRSQGTVKRGKRLTVADVDEDHATSVDLYARFVLKGWRGLRDKSGSVVPFSPEAAKRFLQSVPRWVFAKIRAFCNDAENFVDLDAETTAKN